MATPARDGQFWNRDEDKRLSKTARRWHSLTLKQIAERHDRTVGAISSRLGRLAIADLRSRGYANPSSVIEGQDILQYVRAQSSGFTDRALRQMYQGLNACEANSALPWTRAEDGNLLRGTRYMRLVPIEYFASKHKRAPDRITARLILLGKKEWDAKTPGSDHYPSLLLADPLRYVRSQPTGFTDRAVEAMWGETVKIPIAPSFPKMFNPYPYQRKIIDELCNWPKERPDVVWIGTKVHETISDFWKRPSPAKQHTLVDYKVGDTVRIGESLYLCTQSGLKGVTMTDQIPSPLSEGAMKGIWDKLYSDLESKSNILMFGGEGDSPYRWHSYGIDFAMTEPKQEKPMETDFHVVFDAANPDRTSRAMPKAEALEEINRRLLRDPLRPVYLLKAEQSFVIGKPVAAKLKPAKVVRVKAARKATK